MPLPQSLNFERCPHCQVDRPNLRFLTRITTSNSEGQNQREWGFYQCNRCGGIVTAWIPVGMSGSGVVEWFPGHRQVSDDIPERARSFLKQARATIHAPDSAIMVAASSIDAMLKNKGYRDGSLYSRIDQAAADHLITSEMALWAHEVRLDANDSRHVDEAAPVPTTQDAERAVEFATALAEFLFVLPARVQRGRQNTGAQAGSP